MKRNFGSPDREWLHPDHFGDEPVYCEAPQNPDDVLYSGSDDEAYDSPSERRIRYETQAKRFLEGKPIFLLSASLRGPFDKKSGWVNPWQSKSTSRAKRAEKERGPAAKKAKAARQCDTSASFGSSSFHHDVPESSTALPQRAHTYIPPPYMDGDTFHRVQDWCDRVVAESEIPTSPSQRASQGEPASADSRRATQQTVRRRSGFTVDTADDEPGNIALGTPSVHNDAEKQGASGISRQNNAQVSPDSTAHHSQPADQRTPEEAAPETMPLRKDSAGRTLGSEEALEAKIPTPNGVMPKATASSALLRTHARSGTDGSFRYRRKDAREKGSSSRSSRLAGPSSSLSHTPEDQNPCSRITPKPKVEDPETTGTVSVMASPVDVTTTEPEAAVPLDEIAAGVQEQEIPEDMPIPVPSQSIRQPAEPATEQSEGPEDDDAETASQIDGPTLVPSESQSGSEHASMPNFGHFSCEKLSQDVISETVGLPRRLLWPKRRRTSRDSLPVFGLETARTPVSNLSLERRSVSPCHLGAPEDPPLRPIEEIEAIQAPAEAEIPIQEDQPAAIDERIEEHVEPMSERVPGSETASEAEDDDMDGIDQVPAEAEAESGLPSDTKAEMQPPSPCSAPEPQSPWIQDERPLPTSEVPKPQELQQNTIIRAAGVQSTPKVAQSPWTKETHIVPEATGIPQLSHPNNAQLSFIASQALGQAASQSPWARGDSQMQLPEVRLFNPLSSPANSHVLPTVDPTSHFPAPHTEDVDNCNTQLPPLHPSTPTTKRSGLPSPDFTLSVKSFKEFMTPSPQPAAKRRRISTAADDRLPSIQALVDAAISNPWTGPSTTKPQRKKQKHHPRPKKRVSWAPLPDEEASADMADISAYSAELTTPVPGKQTEPSHRLRASSPPPSILSLSASKLPGTYEKFGKHFAAVASRRVGMAPILKQQQKPQQQQQLDDNKTRGEKKKRGLLPSASQQVCASPAVGGMAEAFLRADATASGGGAAAFATSAATGEVKAGLLSGGGPEGCRGEVNREPDEDVTTEGLDPAREGEDGDTGELRTGLAVDVPQRDEGDDEEEEDEEEQMTQDTQEDMVEAQMGEEMPVDEVSAVMENLDDFLGGNWDLEADLARARAETGRESRAVSNGGLGMSGLMDVGVWD